MDEFLAIIKMFGGNFAPRGWALCNGQILSIAQNTALFSLLGTTFGGNGQTTFALPDLRGRVPIHPGQGPGLSPYSLGQQAGSESITLTLSSLPPHSHTLIANASAQANIANPTGNFLSVGKVPSSSETINMYSNAAGTNPLNAASITPVGGGQPVPIIQPYLCVNFIICLEGIFPSRN